MTTTFIRYLTAKMASSATTPFTTLDKFYAVLNKVQPTSTANEWSLLTDFFTKDAVLYLQGMGGPSVTGSEATVDAIKSLKSYWALVERRQRTRALSADGKTAIVEMDNHLTIFGEHVEHFPETEVVEFNDVGKIISYRLYCDGTPLKDIVAKRMASQ